MKRKTVIKTVAGVTVAVVLLIFFSILFIKARIEKKIQTALHKYETEIGEIHISFLSSGLELNNINIRGRQQHISDGNLYGEIASVKCRGINLFKLIFENCIDIREVSISNSHLTGVITFPDDPGQPVISSMNIRIEKILFDKINLELKTNSSAKTYSVADGTLNLYGLQVGKMDTLSLNMLKQFDFKAKRFSSVTADSMYTVMAGDIIYAAASNHLAVTRLSIHPNYTGHDFTSRHKFQSDCIEAEFGTIHVHDFSAADYLQTGGAISSYVEVEKMDMKIFRDRRKKFHHVARPMFQDLIYNYRNKINIDSICLKTGNITYVEHAVNANRPGRISFNQINARIYNMTNDPIYKTEKAYLELKCNALLMGKGKLTMALKSELYNSDNTFSLHGTLSRMEAKALNPLLERNAFLYATSGKIDQMNFSLTANNHKATGRMTMLYHGLHVTIKHKQTDDTTAFKERIISLLANRKVMDSNPLKGKKVRVGIIDHERNPEKFLFNYCFKAILSGMKSSLAKKPGGKKL